MTMSVLGLPEPAKHMVCGLIAPEGVAEFAKSKIDRSISHPRLNEGYGGIGDATNPMHFTPDGDSGATVTDPLAADTDGGGVSDGIVLPPKQPKCFGAIGVNGRFLIRHAHT